MGTIVRPVSAMLNLTYHEQNPNRESRLLRELKSAIRSLTSSTSVRGSALVAAFAMLLKLPALWRWSVNQLRIISQDTVPQARNVTVGQLAAKAKSSKYAMLK